MKPGDVYDGLRLHIRIFLESRQKLYREKVRSLLELLCPSGRIKRASLNLQGVGFNLFQI
ncbi:hypothetical protein VB735_26725 [Halotia wernerae UHCC 0503]|nr:hypothetical protein [Halotia wernerae UHCC 0503]